MKTPHYIFLILTLLFLSCGSDDDRVTESTAIYEFFEDAEMTLVIGQNFDTLEFESGTNTVFKYFFRAEDDEDIADDEYAESIYFQVDGSLDSFSYSDSELQGLSLFIRRSCFCNGTGFVFTDIGTVSGTKLSNGNWDISISMTFEWDENSTTETRTINENFRLAPLPN